MRSLKSLLTVVLFVLVCLSTAIPCGPGYISPLFDTNREPEEPFVEFAGGKLGIVKNTYRRAVLLPAYRYITGGSLSAEEQRGLIDAWNADINNKAFTDYSVDEAVKTWVAKRKDVVGPDAKTPEIYVERSYGGFEFFPNCTKNAFETAAETLSDRMSAHGPTDSNVQNWLAAQDQVFANCSAGKRTPDDAPAGAPGWLQKDRAYQRAAAEFYSLDYPSARRHFGEIAADSDSPWAETASYLVARTLIRQAGILKGDKAAKLYDEAEKQLEKFSSRTGKFTSSAARLLALVKYRNHPKERVSELARILSGYGNNDDFRQSVIDYNWLLDKFESEIMAEDARQQAEAQRLREQTPADAELYNKVVAAIATLDVTVQIAVVAGEVTLTGTVPKDKIAEVLSAISELKPKKVTNQMTEPDPEAPEGLLEVKVWSDDYSKTWSIYVKPDASDNELIAEAEKVMGIKISDEKRKSIIAQRDNAYSSQFADRTNSSYEGGYYGDEKLTPGMLPDFLSRDELTLWLFIYKMPAETSYPFASDRFASAGGDLWLMTAISKASSDSPGVTRLLEAASNADRTAPAYTTIAYHETRLLLEQGKTLEARKVLEENLALGDRIPVSARNAFLQLKLKLAVSMDDWITASLRKPYAFDFDGNAGTIEQLIAEEKSWFDPENENHQTREQYDAEVEDRFKDERRWSGRQMFDTDVIHAFNNKFTTARLIEAAHSPVLPEYLRERFATSIWMRSWLLNDPVTLLKMTPELAKTHPEFADELNAITAAKTPAARNAAILFFVLKNPILTPNLEDGMGRTDNEQGEWDPDNWWCAPYDDEEGIYDNYGNEITPLPRPPFITAAQAAAAKAEKAKLTAIGDAPQFLGKRVLAWARIAPADKRVPEALYITIVANGWNKYGCGSDEDVKNELKDFIKKRYPDSEWTKKVIAEEADQ